MITGRSSVLALFLLSLWTPTNASAWAQQRDENGQPGAERNADRRVTDDKSDENGKKAQAGLNDPGEAVEVELFDAMQGQQLEVRVIAHSFSLISVYARNATRQPLKVKLPSTFGAIPIHRRSAASPNVAGNQAGAQRPGSPRSNRYDQGGSQGLGGSMGDPGGEESLAGQPREGRSENEDATQHDDGTGPFWLIPPGKIFRQQLPVFCLEFGRPDPSRHVPYRLCKLEEVNQRPIVRDLLKRFGRGDVDQRVAQLAAWQVANDVPWQALAKVQVTGAMARRGKRFFPKEFLVAKQLIESLPAFQRQFGPGGLGR